MRYANMALGLVVVAAAACTDPVRDDAVAALPPESGPITEEHRPGQPCVVCHRDSGPASRRPFSVAGTIYDTKDSGRGADAVDVHLVSGDGSEFWTRTNRAGNFWVDQPAWDPSFPLMVKIGKAGVGGRPMTTFIGRERSCAGCHFKAKSTPTAPGVAPPDYEPFIAVAPVYLMEQP